MKFFRWLIVAAIATFANSEILSMRSHIMIAVAVTTVTCVASPEVSAENYSLANKSFSWTYHERNVYFATTDSDSDEHKPLYPLDTSDWIGLIAAIIGLMMAAGGGIGGGGILVPVYVLIMSFHAKEAVPLSNATILGGAVANMILNNRKRHPKKDRPLVNWDLILIMEPPTIGGAIVGSFLSKMLPDEVIVTCLVVLLSIISYRSIRTGMRLYEKESREITKEQEKVNESAPLIENGDAGGESNENSKKSDFGAVDEQANPNGVDSQSEELKNIIEQERHTPILKVLFLTGFFFITLGLSFYQKLLTCGSTAYVLMFVATFAWIILISSATRYQLVKEWRKRQEAGYHFMEGDVQWTPKNAMLYPSLCTFAGIFAGLFGIGGGIVKGPLMLELGVIPQVASATSACMILYTSFTATCSYLAFGLLKVDYAILLVFVGFFATCVGQLIISHLVQMYNRSSLIVLSVGCVIALSAVLLGWESVFSILTSTDTTSTGFCDFGAA